MSERVKGWGGQKWDAGWIGGKTGPTCPSCAPVVAGEDWPCIPVGYGMETVAIAIAQDKGNASAQDIANLIAAAPALVEALEAFVSNSSVQANMPSECENAEDVLAMVYGETQ